MRKLKLLFFFNLVFIPILVLGFVAAGYILREQLDEGAEKEVLQYPFSR